VPRRSTIALATVGALASTGTAYLGARNLLVGQATQARTIIPKSWDIPPRADGVYTRGAGMPTYIVTGIEIDRNDIRDHARNERLGVESFYRGNEFFYRYLKSITRAQL